MSVFAVRCPSRWLARYAVLVASTQNPLKCPCVGSNHSMSRLLSRYYYCLSHRLCTPCPFFFTSFFIGSEAHNIIKLRRTCAPSAITSPNIRGLCRTQPMQRCDLIFVLGSRWKQFGSGTQRTVLRVASAQSLLFLDRSRNVPTKLHFPQCQHMALGTSSLVSCPRGRLSCVH